MDGFGQNVSLFSCSFARLRISGGQPPFYMMAVDVNGGTTTHKLEAYGDGGWAWAVDRDVGAQLLLSVVDANGASGGVSSESWTVQPGERACAASTPFIPGLNVTAKVIQQAARQCQRPPLSVPGGTAPYTFTLLERGAHALNITADFIPEFSSYAAPGSSIIVIVSDASGLRSQCSPELIMPEVPCSGDPSRQSVLKRSSPQISNFPIILGAIVGLVIFFVLASASVVAFWAVRRHRRRRACSFQFGTAGQVCSLSVAESLPTNIFNTKKVVPYPVTRAHNVVVDLAESPPHLSPLNLSEAGIDMTDSASPIDNLPTSRMSGVSFVSGSQPRPTHPYAAPSLAPASASSVVLNMSVESPPSPIVPIPARLATVRAASVGSFPKEKDVWRANQHHRIRSASSALPRTRVGGLPAAGPSGLRNAIAGGSDVAAPAERLLKPREAVRDWKRRPSIDESFRPSVFVGGIRGRHSSPRRVPVAHISTSMSPVRPLPVPPLSAPVPAVASMSFGPEQGNNARFFRETRLRHVHSAGDVHAAMRAKQREAGRQLQDVTLAPREIARHLSIAHHITEYTASAGGSGTSQPQVGTGISPPPPYSELTLARILTTP
ncbi:hypothetical protein K488DRAFT_83748 [Vararia minispora EC-137]|uniref:Uncharacterized protein n=1 Tax=Vararia minispora EC-137 TaxID=1314806 RepID=A0ACB8QS65_9AGAM|nr:hypothetical protein K488DRAFT_83748 [Vararia minispora EC-137]